MKSPAQSSGWRRSAIGTIPYGNRVDSPGGPVRGGSCDGEVRDGSIGRRAAPGPGGFRLKALNPWCWNFTMVNLQSIAVSSSLVA
jgi:hypothetical protein